MEREEEAMMKELNRLVQAVELEEEFTDKDEAFEEKLHLMERKKPEPELSPELKELHRLVTAYYLENHFTEVEKETKEAMERIAKTYGGDGSSAAESTRQEDDGQDRELRKHLEEKYREKESAAENADSAALDELNRLAKAYYLAQNWTEKEVEQKERSELERLAAAAIIEANFSKPNDVPRLSIDELIDVVKKYLDEKSTASVEDQMVFRELNRLAQAYWIEQNLSEKEVLTELERLASAVSLEIEFSEQEPVLSEDKSLEADELRRLVRAYYVENHPHVDADEASASQLERLARVYLIANHTKRQEKKKAEKAGRHQAQQTETSSQKEQVQV